jgi:hypothetical protein
MVWNGVQRPTGSTFKILSFDGGGIRGAFAASFLARVEEKLKTSIVEHFDLIAGTSTGGIIAVALAMGLPAVQIESLYREHGLAIFTRRPRIRLSWWMRVLAARVDKRLRAYGLDVDGFLQSKYKADVLRTALAKELGDRTLEQARTRLVVPSVNLTLGQTKVFKTPHLPGMFEDRHLTAIDVILATTAAPTYFPHATIGRAAYADGGLWANNPSMVALVEAGRIRDQCRRPEHDPTFGLPDIYLLSVGAGSSIYRYDPPTVGAGLGWWGPRLYETMSISQSQGVDFQARHVLGPNRYFRVDFQQTDRPWGLDDTNHIDQLLGLGEGAATANLARLEPIFFSHKIAPYKPFPDLGPPPIREAPCREGL